MMWGIPNWLHATMTMNQDFLLLEESATASTHFFPAALVSGSIFPIHLLHRHSKTSINKEFYTLNQINYVGPR